MKHEQKSRFGFRILLISGMSFLISGTALADETDLEIVAVEARKAGVECINPLRATHVREKSSANRAVWHLECENASYEVVIDPERRPSATRIETN